MPEILKRERENKVIVALRQNPQQSFLDLALATNYARCTVYEIVRRLTVQGRLRKVQGRGRLPNSYELL